MCIFSYKLPHVLHHLSIFILGPAINPLKRSTANLHQDMSGLDNAATIHATHQSAVPVPQFMLHHSISSTCPTIHTTSFIRQHLPTIHTSFVWQHLPTIHTTPFNWQYLSQGLHWPRTWHLPWCMRWPRNLQSDSGHGRSSGILMMAALQQHCIQYPAQITWMILSASGSGYSTFTTLWTYFSKNQQLSRVPSTMQIKYYMELLRTYSCLWPPLPVSSDCCLFQHYLTW